MQASTSFPQLLIDHQNSSPSHRSASSMAERVPSPPHHLQVPDDNPSSETNPTSPKNDGSQPALIAGTYIVQVPKDQIYWVPPPENAWIAERNRNPDQMDQKRRHCSCCCCFVFIAVLVLVVSIAAALGILSIFLKIRDPRFKVQKFVVLNKNNSNPDYSIRLEAENPNSKTSISYKDGGVASLYYKQQKVAGGKYPPFYQEQKNSAGFEIGLHGSKIALRKEIEESLRGRKPKLHVGFALKIDVSAHMKTWVFSRGNVEFAVACDFSVDSLGEGTHILSQTCQTNR